MLLALLLVVLAITGAIQSSDGSTTSTKNPNFLELRFTFRDFLPATCIRQTEIGKYWPERSCTNCKLSTHFGTCPLLSERQAGTLRAHPDFQISWPSTSWQDPATGNMLWTPGFGTSGIGRTTQSRPWAVAAKQYVDNSLRLTPMVKDLLNLNTESGIPKIVPYDGLGRLLGAPYWYVDPSYNSVRSFRGYTDLSSSAGPEHLNEWFNTNTQVNRAVGKILRLHRNSVNGKFFYNSSADANGRFHPLDEFTAPKVFPLTPEELAPEFFGDNGWKSGGGGRNYFFTSEHHSFFEYTGGEVFSFSGDDDFWCFINGRLAVDLGGQHMAYQSSVNLDSAAKELGLKKGQVYSLDLFHAERRIRESQFHIETTLAKGCSISNHAQDALRLSRDTASTLIASSALKLVGSTLKSDGSIDLVQSGVPGMVGYLWYATKREYVGQGFSVEFVASTTAQATEGMALVIHGDPHGISNANGGSFGHLGARGFRNAISVHFDMCPDRDLGPETVCGKRAEIRLATSREGVLRRASLYYPSGLDVLNKTQRVRVAYYARPNWIDVYVDDELMLTHRAVDLEKDVGGTSAWIGLTGSTGPLSRSGGVSISEWLIQTVGIDPKLSAAASDEESLQSFVANGRDLLEFSVRTFDACGHHFSAGGYADWVEGFLVEMPATPEEEEASPTRRRLVDGRVEHQEYEYYEYEYETSAPLSNSTTPPPLSSACAGIEDVGGPYACGASTPNVVRGKVVDHEDGTYGVLFKTRLPAVYSVQITFGEACAGASNLSDPTIACWLGWYPSLARAIVTPAPTAPDVTQVPLGAYGLSSPVLYSVLASIGGVLLFCCCCAVFSLKYKRKWKKEKEFADAGKLAALDLDLEMHDDPQLWHMANKVQASAERVRSWRTVQDPGMNRSKDIQNLSEQVNALSNWVKTTKQQQQIDQARRVTSGEFRSEELRRHVQFGGTGLAVSSGPSDGVANAARANVLSAEQHVAEVIALTEGRNREDSKNREASAAEASRYVVGQSPSRSLLPPRSRAPPSKATSTVIKPYLR